MKKIILLLVFVLFSATCASAQWFNSDCIKKTLSKSDIQPTNNSTRLSENDTLTPNEQAMLAYNENDIKSAFEILIAIKESDRSVQDWVLLGNILQDQDKTSDAIFMYKKAITLNPKYYKPYYNLGNIYLEEEKPVLAIENYRKANKINNNFSYAYYNLGCAYLKIGELKKSKIAFLKAIELKNTEPNFYYNLAYTYKMLDNPKLSKQYLGFYNKLMENNK